MNKKHRSHTTQSLWGLAFLLLFSLLICITTSGYCRVEKAIPQNTRKIIAVISADFPPTCFRDETTGQAAGFSVDVMNEVALRSGFVMEYIYAESWDMMELAVLSEKADLVPNLTIDEERLKSMIFTVPVETLKISRIARASDTAHNSIEAGMKIGVMKGSSVDHFLSKRVDIIRCPYSGIQQLLLDLLAGHIDMAMTATLNILKLARDAGIEDRIRIIEPCEYEAKRGMALRPGDEVLRNQLNEVIEEFVGTLEYQKLYLKWWGKPIPFWNTLRVVWTMSGVIAVLAGIFLFWHFREAKRAEDVLRETSQRLQFAISSGRLGVWDWDIESNILVWDDRMFELYGVTRESFTKCVELWQNGLHPDDLADALEATQTAVLGEKEYNTEFRVVHPDGTLKWLKTNGLVIRNKDGKALRMIGLTREVTERRQAENALRESEGKFRSLAESSTDYIMRYDRQCRHLYMNQAGLQVTGMEAIDLIGKTHRESGFPEDLCHLWEERIMQVFETSDPSQIEFKWTGADGLVVLELRLSPEFDTKGKVCSVLGVSRDITERKLAEEELRANRRQLKDIIEFLPDATLAIDKEGRVIIWNRAIEEMTGVPATEMIGKGDYAYTIPFYGEARPQLMDVIFMEHGDILTRYPNVIREGNSLRVEVFCRALYNNKGAWVFAKASPLYDQDGKIVGAIESIRDITERKRVEEELLHLNETLEHRVAQEVEKNLKHEILLIQQSRLAAMGEMIGNIAHQWRQPLNALGLLLFNIKDAYQFNTLDAAYLDQTVADGRRMIQKMSTTISDFFNFFRPNKEVITFSALEQIREAIVLVDSSFQNSNISIHIDAPQDLKILGFPNEYSQVLLNLLSNAKEAILSCNQKHSGRVDIVLTEQDGQGCVSVCDNGGGIADEILGRIFDPYFSTKEQGTGIGLYMSKMIIERNMNGSITANNLGGGAEFTVCVPLARDGQYNQS